MIILGLFYQVLLKIYMLWLLIGSASTNVLWRQKTTYLKIITKYSCLTNPLKMQYFSSKQGRLPTLLVNCLIFISLLINQNNLALLKYI